MAKTPNLNGNCEYQDCNRPLLRKTGHIIFNANTNEYESICRYCFLQDPSYGRKKVTQ